MEENLKKRIKEHGREINKIKEDIARLKVNPNDDDLVVIEKLEEALRRELEVHKELLKQRYSEDFLKKKM